MKCGLAQQSIAKHTERKVRSELATRLNEADSSFVATGLDTEYPHPRLMPHFERIGQYLSILQRVREIQVCQRRNKLSPSRCRCRRAPTRYCEPSDPIVSLRMHTSAGKNKR